MIVHVRDVADREDHVSGEMFLCDPFVYIGRFQHWGAGRYFAKSIWHNPFFVKRYGREEALRLFEDYARSDPRLMARLPELRGKVLACWCAPLPCHGDVLLRLLAETNTKENEMTHATKEQYAELVGYTGHDERMEIRLCTSADQVWSYDWQHGVGQGLGRLGYWVGTDLQHEFVGLSPGDVVEYRDYLDAPVRWLS